MSPTEPKDASPWRQVGVILSLVFTIPAGVAIGGILGAWIDSKAGTGWLFTLILLGLGFVGGVLEVLRELKKLNRQ